MDETEDGRRESEGERREPFAQATHCVACGGTLGEPFGWCSNCQSAFCVACGDRHYCMSACQMRGCLAGFCVREVKGGVVGAWKRVPQEG